MVACLMHDKKITLCRVTQPYLNLLVKPKISFQVFCKKKYKFMHFERRNAFQNAQNYTFF